jgi:3'-5' exoribonuclease
LSLCTLGKLTAAHYPEVDRELLLTGIILHDIGKVEELSYSRSFGYSAEGQLLGHIVLGLRLLAAKLQSLPDFPPRLRTLVEHMIVSHHGELEFGSPKLPLFPEALLLHHLDNLDSKMNAMRTVLGRDGVSESEFTGWVAPLERVLLRKERYLRGTADPTPTATESKPASSSSSSTLPIVDDAAEQAPVELHGEPPHPAPANPATPQAPPPKPALQPSEKKPELQRGQMNTLFGEKLQAVLEGRK